MYAGIPLASSRGTVSSQLVEKACRHWEARRQAAAAQQHIPSRASLASTVALAREAGTDGTAVAREVGNLLGWHVYDHELLEHIAKELGLRTALLESVDERNQSWLRDTMEGFAEMPTRSEFGPFVGELTYVHRLVQTITALGAHGECVIVGRGSPFILPAATTLRVRLMGPVKDRITALSRKLGISERDAAQKVRSTDRERSDFVQDHFFKDPSDPHNYDLVVNATRLSTKDCAELIVETLHRLQALREPQGGSK